jgi:hypothetical protein
LREHNWTLLAAPLGAALLILLLVALAVSGQWPGMNQMVKFTPHGLIATPLSEVTRVDIRIGQESMALSRQANHWTIDGILGAVPTELASHIDTALRLLQVSEPARVIPAEELTTESFAAFGLDPPTQLVVLGNSQGTIATINFGSLNPASTSQYVRLAGAATVHLLPRHVGNEWQVTADMARRLRGHVEPAVASRATSLLLPVSLAQVWAVEIVFAGKLTRFERDGGGNWFRHVGQHSHAGGTNVHVADPDQARVIAAALEAFDQATIEKSIAHGAAARDVTRFGLALPSLIVLVYGRDNSSALARIEFGAAADTFNRYARLAPDGDIVIVAEFEVKRLADLLKTIGAGL